MSKNKRVNLNSSSLYVCGILVSGAITTKQYFFLLKEVSINTQIDKGCGAGEQFCPKFEITIFNVIRSNANWHHGHVIVYY